MSGYYKIRETTSPQIGTTNTTAVEIPAVLAGVDLIAANPNRKAMRIINETDTEMLIAIGTLELTPASAINKILILPPQSAWTFGPHELPLQALNAIWVESPTGKVVVVQGV